MKNYVFNKIHVYGKKESVVKFMEEVKTRNSRKNDLYPKLFPLSDFDFSSIIEKPFYVVDVDLFNTGFPNLESTLLLDTSEYKVIPFKGWCKEHWGADSNALNTDIETEIYSDGYITTTYSFETISEAPFIIFKTLVLKYPDLEFSFDWRKEDDDSSYFVQKAKSGGICNISIIKTLDNEEVREIEYSGLLFIFNETPFTVIDEIDITLVDEYRYLLSDLNKN